MRPLPREGARHPDLYEFTPVRVTVPRNLVERLFNRIKPFRRIATRYDKLAENCLAAVKLAAVRVWLRDF